MKNRKTLVITLLVLAGAAGIAFATRLGGEPVQPAQGQAGLLAVETQQPARGDLVSTTRFVGRVEPGEWVYVLPKASGEVLATHFAVGDTVQKGDVLLEIDPADVQLQVDIAQAAYRSAEASVDQALGGTLELNVLQSESGYKQAVNAYLQANQAWHQVDDGVDDARAARNAARTAYQAAEDAYQQALKDSGGQDSEELDALLAQRNEAKLALTEAETAYQMLANASESQYTQLEMGVDNARLAMETARNALDITTQRVIEEATAVAQAQLDAAAAQLAASQRQLSYTKVTAPIGGVIELRAVEVHDYASPNSYTYVISNRESLTVHFSVTESAVSGLQAGDAITVYKGGQSCPGVIVEVAGMPDPGSGLFPVKASVEPGALQLHSGTNVTVEAGTAHAEDALLLPVNALYHEEGRPFVYLYDEGTVRVQWVEKGVANEEQVAITAGLTPDSQVITSWNPQLKDGLAVTLYAPQPAQPAGA